MTDPTKHAPMPSRNSRARRAIQLALLVAVSLDLLIPGALGLIPPDGAGVAGAIALADPSGQTAPRGDLPGWHQVLVDDFATEVARGDWPGPYAARWTTYPNGWPDSAGKAGIRSEYQPSRVLSARGGLLDYWVHTDRGKTQGAVIVPLDPDGGMLYQRYGRYAVRFRADPVPGYKMAFLLWPQSEEWPRDGEIDFPEGNLTATIDAYMHFQGASSGSDQDRFPTDSGFAAWHTAVIEWTPESVLFILDDHVVGRSTQRIPNTPMRWTLQIERCLDRCEAPTDAEGHVQVDWVAQYRYEPETLGDPPPDQETPIVPPLPPDPTIIPAIPLSPSRDGMPAPGLITFTRAGIRRAGYVTRG